MPRKVENIYKRKDGRWEGRYIRGRTAEGKAIYKSIYAKSYKAVKEKIKIANQIQIETCNHTLITHVRYGDIADKWLNSKMSQVKESTLIKYTNMLQKYILPCFQELEASHISSEKVEAFVSNLLAVGGSNNAGLSEKTVADIISIMRSIEKYGIVHGSIKNTSCANISVKQKIKPLCVLSTYEEELLIDYLIKNMNYRNFGKYLCLFTGIRIGELCALTWNDISLQERLLYIHSTMQRIQTNDPSASKKRVF